MSQVFISYANEDTEFAKRLAGAFEGHGWTGGGDTQMPPECRRLQAVDLKHWQVGIPHPGFELLVQRVGSILDEPPRPTPSPVSEPSPPGRPVPRKEALTTWGSGRQRACRIGGALAALFAVGGVAKALDMGAAEIPTGALGFLGLAVHLFHAGRRPA